LSLLADPPHFLFFTGKGGIGKTPLACACALALADAGQRVLLVSTDPASNLDDMLGVALLDRPRVVPGAPTLEAMNIDPEAAAEAYRARVIAQMPDSSDVAERSTVREQLSGACTTEIAAFDEFIGLLAGDATGYDHVIFDTAPTGHTLLLMDAIGAYHRQMTRQFEGSSAAAHAVTPPMRLQDQDYTRIVLATLPEVTLVSEAAALQDDLRSGLSESWRALQSSGATCANASARRSGAQACSP
jgi:arsenite-transporting ATPase